MQFHFVSLVKRVLDYCGVYLVDGGGFLAVFFAVEFSTHLFADLGFEDIAVQFGFSQRTFGVGQQQPQTVYDHREGDNFANEVLIVNRQQVIDVNFVVEFFELDLVDVFADQQFPFHSTGSCWLTSPERTRRVISMMR